MKRQTLLQVKENPSFLPAVIELGHQLFAYLQTLQWSSSFSSGIKCVGLQTRTIPSVSWVSGIQAGTSPPVLLSASSPLTLQTLGPAKGIESKNSVQLSHSVVSDSLRPHESQHARPPCPSPTPGVHSDSRPSSSDAIQPSHPLSSPSPPAPNPSQHQSLFQWVNSSHEVAKVLEFQL